MKIGRLTSLCVVLLSCFVRFTLEEAATGVQSECGFHEFTCEGGTCIPQEQVCDGTDHCPHGDDEAHCGADEDAAQCQDGEFPCRDRLECVPASEVCDGHEDCTDGSDEAGNCEAKCQALKCATNSQCLLTPSGDVQCVCRKGFHIDPGHGDACIDIDECGFSDERRACDHVCHNTPGSFICFCDPGYKISADKRTCQLIGPEPMLIAATADSIFSYKMDSRAFSLLLDGLGNVQGLAVDNDGRRVFWTESAPPRQPAVYVADLDHPDATRRTVAAFGLRNPHGLTFDPVQKNLYVADPELPAILACRTHPPAPPPTTSTSSSSSLLSFLSSTSTATTTVSSDFVCVTVYNASHLQRPTDVSLDHRNGFLYWIDLGPRPRIVSGCADGIDHAWNDRSHDDGDDSASSVGTGRGRSHGPHVVVSARLGKPTSLVLDVSTARLFWVDAMFNLLECVGLDGRGRRIVQGADIQRPSAVVVLENYAIWANDGASGKIMTAEKFTGHNARVFFSGKSRVRAMAVHHTSMEKSKDLSSCLGKSCSDVCLVGERRSAVCACQDGLTLNTQSGDCTGSDKQPVLFAASKDEIVSLSLGQYNALLPTSVTSGDMKNVFALAHLPDSGDLVYSNFEAVKGHVGRSSIYRLNLAGDRKSTALVEDAGSVHSLAVDEPSRLIYWVDRRKSTVELLSLDGQLRSRLSVEDIRRPFALALDIPHGSLYVSDLGSPVTIDSCHLDGRDCLTLVSKRLVRPDALTTRGERLYWTDSGSGDVSSVDVHTLEVTHHGIARNFPSSLAVFGEFLLWAELEAEIIFYVRLRHSSGHSSSPSLDLPTEIWTGRKGLTSVVVAAPGPATFHEAGPTAHNCSDNGGCDHFCIPGLDRVTCLCSDGYRLLSDQASCESEDPVPCDGFSCENGSKCLTPDQVCDAVLQCSDGSDELDCKVEEGIHTCAQDEIACDSGLCLPYTFQCDGHEDCDDGTDEAMDTCRDFQRTCDSEDHACADGSQCVPLFYLCDGDRDCNDASDEVNCSRPGDSASQTPCKPGRFYCPSTDECVAGLWRCDGDADCVNGEDEVDCPSITCSPLHHLCPNGLCVLDYQQCGKETDLALPSPTPSCLQTEYQCGDGTCIDDFLVCDTFYDCDDDSDEDCDETIDWFDPCEDGFQCSLGECVHRSMVCDGEIDCSDGSDEMNCKFTCAQLKGCSQRCEDTPRGPVCACFHGYRLINPRFCDDVDECAERNGGCTQVCTNHRGGFRCSCLEGFTPQVDGIGCKAAGAKPQIYVGANLGIFEFHTAIRELGEVVLATDASPQSLDLNVRTGEVYWTAYTPGISHSTVVYKSTLGHPSATAPITRSRENIFAAKETIRDFALDWVTGNLYLVIQPRTGPAPAGVRIQVLSGDGHVATIITDREKRGAVWSQGLVLHPGKQLLFYLSSPGLVSSWMDGSHRVSIIKDLNPHASALSIDHPTGRLYWVDGAGSGRGLNVCNLDGSQRYQIAKLKSPVVFMDVFEGMAYMSSTLDNYLERLPTYGNPRSSSEPGVSKASTQRRERKGRSVGYAKRQSRKVKLQEGSRFGVYQEKKQVRVNRRSTQSLAFWRERGLKARQKVLSSRIGPRHVASFHQFPSPGPVKVMHALKQPNVTNQCANTTCLFLCVPTPDGARCLCPDHFTPQRENPSCNGTAAKPSQQTDLPENAPTLQPSIRPSSTESPISTETTRTQTRTPLTSTQRATPPGRAPTARPTVSRPRGPPHVVVLTTKMSAAAAVTPPTTTQVSSGTECACQNGGSCDRAVASPGCICQEGYTGDLCQDAIEKPAKVTNKGANSLSWVAGVVVALIFLALVGVAVSCYFKRRRGRASLISSISYKNPRFSRQKLDHDSLESHISFSKADLEDEEVDEEKEPDGDWWKRLLERSRISVDSGFIGRPSCRPSIAKVVEVEEEEEEVDEVEEEEGEVVVREVGRKGAGEGPKVKSNVGGVGKDPQCYNTSDDARLLW